MAIWQSIIKLILMLLSAGMVIATAILCFKLVNTSKKLYNIILKFKWVVYTILLLLIFSLPIAFSLHQGILLSALVLSAWGRELLISLVIVVTVWAIWTVLDNPSNVKRIVLTMFLQLLLKVWKKEPVENLQTTAQVSYAFRYFIAEEYYILKDMIGDRPFRATLMVGQLGIATEKIGTREYLMVFNMQDPFAESVHIHNKGSERLELQDRYANNEEEANILWKGLST